MRIALRFAVLVFAACFLSVTSTDLHAQSICGTGVCVLTWHNDTYRTGQNLNESALTYNSINKDTLGQRCSVGLDGQVYAQPLVATNVTINNVFYPWVVYVVTQYDTLYAINGTPPQGVNQTCQIIRQLPFLSTSGLPTNGQYPVDCAEIGGGHCTSMDPYVGILGTPVINVSGGTGTIYLVTETQDAKTGASNWYHYLYAVDIQSLQATSWVEVLPSGGCTLKGCFSQTHIQRPGLLLANCGSGCQNKNYVYVTFSMMDGAGIPYTYGAMFGYNAANLSDPNVFFLQTSQGGTAHDGAGMWMGGAGPAFGTDSGGQSWIYVTTANGTFDLTSGGSDASDSLLKLNPNGLAIGTPSGGYGYFTPVDQAYRGNDVQCNPPKGNDVDFGSGGVMLVPDNQLANWPYLAVSGDKEGGLWFVDRTNLGGYNTACGNSCNCTPSNSGNNIQTYWTGSAYRGNTIHGDAAF